MFLETQVNLGFKVFTVAQILTLLVIVVVCAVVSKIILVIFDKTLKKTGKDKQVKSFLRPVLRFLLFLVSGLIILDYLSVPLTPFITILSVVGVALSLSLQDVLSNIFGGAMLFFAKPFSVGDFVEVANLSGKCISISTLYTQLLTIDNKQVFIPNKSIIASSITNYTSQQVRMVEVKIGVSYESNEQSVSDALWAAVNSLPAVLDEPQPLIAVNDYKDSAVEYIIRFWTRTEDFASTRFAFMSTMRKKFNEYHVDIPYNHLNVHIVDTPNN